MKSSFTGNNWINVQKKFREILNNQMKKEAQMIFLDWASENVPSVPHHLVRKRREKENV